MIIACPACRAENAERTCRRCRADLGLLWDLEAQRERLLVDAAEAIRRGEFTQATERAQSAYDLRVGSDAGRLIACVYLLRGQFVRAFEWHAFAAKDS